MVDKNEQSKLENKDNFLLRLKKKLLDRHIYSIMIVILAVIVGITIYMYKQKANFEGYLQNTFQQSFYESAQYIDDVDNLLSKITVTSKPSQRIKIFTDVYREASAALSNIGRLPYNQAIITKILKFLTQLSDFSYAMLLKSSENQDFTVEEVKQIKELSSYSNVLATQMNKIKSDISDGNRINWNEVKKESEQNLQDSEGKNDNTDNVKNQIPSDGNSKMNTEKIDNTMANSSTANANKEKEVTGSISEVQKVFQNYPSLIYDGPFSDHIELMEPKMLKDKDLVSKEVAKEKAISFLGKDKIENIELIFFTETKEKYVIPVYRFKATLKNSKEYTVTLDITQQGGYPLWMLNYKDVADTGKKLDINELSTKIKTELNNLGYKDMEVNYYETLKNIVVFNFAYEQDGVTVYPDLIKVKVSLVDGEILGFESLGYLMAHTQRQFTKVKLTEDDAKGEVNKDFNIESVKKTLIPLQSKKEVLCYELKGNIGEKEYLVYVNVENGRFENILQLIKNENGVFTQ